MNLRCWVQVVLLSTAFGAHAGQLYVISLKTGETRQLTRDESHDRGSPDWSPDGGQIAFDIWPAGPNYSQSDVAVIDAQGGPVKRLAPGAMPSWSPDGGRMVFRTYASDGGVIVMNADGSGSETIIDYWATPRWGPKGNEIITTYRGGLAQFDLATGEMRALTGNFGVWMGFSISPNGKRFCISMSGGGLGIVDFDATLERWEVTDRLPSSYETRHTSWSPDGKRVVVLIRDKDPDGVFAADPERKPPLRLYLLTVDDDSPPVRVPGVPLHWKCIDADWSSDGEWIAFIRTDSEVHQDK